MKFLHKQEIDEYGGTTKHTVGTHIKDTLLKFQPKTRRIGRGLALFVGQGCVQLCIVIPPHSSKRNVSRHAITQPLETIQQYSTVKSSGKLHQQKSGGTAYHQVGLQFIAICSSRADSIDLRRDDVPNEFGPYSWPSSYTKCDTMV